MQVREEPYLLDEIKEQYRDQSKLLGFEIKIPELALVKEGDKLEMMDRPDDALPIFLEMHKIYPEGLMGYDRLGGLYSKKGDIIQAIKYYKGFLERQPENPRIISILEELNGKLE